MKGYEGNWRDIRILAIISSTLTLGLEQLLFLSCAKLFLVLTTRLWDVKTSDCIELCGSKRTCLPWRWSSSSMPLASLMRFYGPFYGHIFIAMPLACLAFSSIVGYFRLSNTSRFSRRVSFKQSWAIAAGREDFACHCVESVHGIIMDYTLCTLEMSFFIYCCTHDFWCVFHCIPAYSLWILDAFCFSCFTANPKGSERQSKSCALRARFSIHTAVLSVLLT